MYVHNKTLTKLLHFLQNCTRLKGPCLHQTFQNKKVPLVSGQSFFVQIYATENKLLAQRDHCVEIHRHKYVCLQLFYLVRACKISSNITPDKISLCFSAKCKKWATKYSLLWRPFHPSKVCVGKYCLFSLYRHYKLQKLRLLSL